MSFFEQFVQRINRSPYKLDATGVVGLYGGDRAADALETIHLYKGRRWAGWYNYPGTATVARRFGQMANSRFWDTLFPGPNESPTITFNLAGKFGPDYSGPYSGIRLRTGYLGYLTAKAYADSPAKPLQLFKEDGTKGRENGSSPVVTIISLPPRHHERIARLLRVPAFYPESLLIPVDPISGPPLALWAIVPSLVGILACVFCFLAHDPLCASLILLGVGSGGFSSLVLGTASLNIRAPVLFAGSPPGDGLMFLENGNILILKGEEADVNIVTKGEFELDYSTGILSHPNHHMIGIISLLLVVQLFAQFLLIPRGTFFGQIMFLVSLLVSAAYHLYVVSIDCDKERLKWELVLRVLSPRMEKWTLGTRTQMAVFACLILGDGRNPPRFFKLDSEDVLKRIIPNETAVWQYWRKKVVSELDHYWRWNSEPSNLPYTPRINAGVADETEANYFSLLTERDVRLLDVLIGDAWCVFNKYSEWRKVESGIGREQDVGAEDNLKSRLLPGGSPA